ncbi:MAG: hypothetical protein H6619_04740 [Deltaproteobacteria bacterium]|nr:hypothetical protein [Deltaproteobacteria bacterium]
MEFKILSRYFTTLSLTLCLAFVIRPALLEAQEKSSDFREKNFAKSHFIEANPRGGSKYSKVLKFKDEFRKKRDDSLEKPDEKKPQTKEEGVESAQRQTLAKAETAPVANNSPDHAISLSDLKELRVRALISGDPLTHVVDELGRVYELSKHKKVVIDSITLVGLAVAPNHPDLVKVYQKFGDKIPQINFEMTYKAPYQYSPVWILNDGKREFVFEGGFETKDIIQDDEE